MPRFSLDDAVKLAASLEKVGDFAKAREIYTKLLQATPGHSQTQAALDAVDEKQRRFAALSEPPRDTLGELSALLARKDLRRLRAHCEMLVRQFPTDYNLWILFGSACRFLRDMKAAADAYRTAARLRPYSGTAFEYLGDALGGQVDVEGALEAYSRALALEPDNAKVRNQTLCLRGHLGDWSALDELEESRAEDEAAWMGIEPFKMLALKDDLDDHARRTRAFAKRQAAPPILPPQNWSVSGADRIRIGYYSADFGNHPVMHLMSGVFREHDRSRFEVFAFSLGSDSDYDLRNQLKQDVEHFVDLRGQTTPAIVQRARAERIDIAIDLMGYTINAPTESFAARLAPVQINFLGYPGTMGAEFMDYIIGDRVLIPEADQSAYAEDVLYLPNSYMPADNRRTIGAPTRRSDHGLPDDAFVFCCFNQVYKFGPREFDIWMRLLKQVEGSVLWMKQPRPQAVENLRREAQARGVDPERLLFCGRLDHAEHIERHRHADLFLDTFNFNAHTTANEALWAGLPVVTRAGRQFSARVAASLLSAAGLPELITDTDEAYESLILDLATHPERLTAIRQKLQTNRDTCALFDTQRYTRDLEKALRGAHEHRLRATLSGR